MPKFSTKRISFKQSMKKTFNRQEMRDIVNHGIEGGYHHLTSYSDITKVYQRFHQDIWEMLNDDTDNMGYKHPIEMIATFMGAGNVSCQLTFENLLVWYAAEHVAYDLTQ
jgi:hypothetical protein